MGDAPSRPDEESEVGRRRNSATSSFIIGSQSAFVFNPLGTAVPPCFNQLKSVTMAYHNHKGKGGGAPLFSGDLQSVSIGTSVLLQSAHRASSIAYQSDLSASHFGPFNWLQSSTLIPPDHLMLPDSGLLLLLYQAAHNFSIGLPTGYLQAHFSSYYMSSTPPSVLIHFFRFVDPNRESLRLQLPPISFQSCLPNPPPLTPTSNLHFPSLTSRLPFATTISNSP